MNQRPRSFCVLVGAVVVTFTGVAFGHGGEVHHERRWTHWTWDPVVLAGVAMMSAAYFTGVVRIWNRAGAMRVVSPLQVWSFAAAVLVVLIALVSPIDAMSDQLQWAHMVQHMLLMMVAAPLFVLGLPSIAMLWSLPIGLRRGPVALVYRSKAWRPAWYALWQPLLLWSVYALTLWIWHLPSLYLAALRNEAVHHAQHLAFFCASVLFWRVLLDPLSRFRLGRGKGVLYLFTTSLHAMFLGVFMALSPGVWYADYEGRTVLWRLTALEDQQIAGLIMWMPACMIYAAAIAAIFAIWLHEPPATQHPPRPLTGSPT